MQEFTRSLTREIQINGERLALTMDKDGLTIRPVGSRRPPTALSWSAFLCAAVGASAEATDDQVAAALTALKAGHKSTPAKAAAPIPAPPPPPPPGADVAMLGVLARIERDLGGHRPRFLKALAAPATPQQLDDAQKKLGRPLPEGLRTLLTWHNGQVPDVIGSFEQCFLLMSADQVADAAQKLKEHPPAGWHSSWLPFLDDHSDSHVVVDTAQLGLPVREVWRGREEHPVVASSLLHWLQRLADGIEHGTFVEDPERGTYYPKEPTT